MKKPTKRQQRGFVMRLHRLIEQKMEEDGLSSSPNRRNMYRQAQRDCRTTATRSPHGTP